MPKYVWMTDIHMDSIDESLMLNKISGIAKFIENEEADGLILSGDISTGTRLVFHLSMLEKAVKKPIYFVLGNHDFWDSSYNKIKEQMVEVSRISSFLKYLPSTPYVQLNNSTCMIGANGWYDAIHGHPTLKVMLMDWIRMFDYQELLIGSPENFEGSARAKPCTGKHLNQIIELSREFSKKGASQVARGIKAAKRASIKNMIIVTHVPPFREVCMFNNMPTDELHLPWYSSKLLGDVLTAAADQLPDCHFTVLSGHTHHYKRERIKKNLIVVSGRSDYGSPGVSDIIEVG